jgi:hypothetical protein
MAGGIVTLVVASVTKSGYWAHGILIVLGNYAVYFFLPVARGYKLLGRGQADVLRHLGDVRGIVSSGSLPGIWYPGEHVLMAMLNMLGVPLESTVHVTGFLLTALHVVAIGLLVRHLSGARGSLAAGLAAGAPLVYTSFHVSGHPAVNSFMLVPVVLVLVERYRRSRRNATLLLFVLLGVTIVVSHPMTTLLLVGMLFVTALYTAVYDWGTSAVHPRVSPRLATVFLPLLFLWISSFRQTRVAVKNVFAPSTGPPPGAEELQQATQISFTPIQLAEKFFTLYGAPFIYISLGGLFTLVVLVAFLRDDRRFEWGFATTQFGVGVAIAGSFLVQDLIVKGKIRASRYALLFAAVLTGLAFVYSIERTHSLGTAVLTMFVVVASIFGANAAYEPNRHLTYAEYDGSQYVALSQEPGVDVYSMDTSHKMEEYVLGTNHPRLWPRSFQIENNVPPQLGYTEPDTTAADTFGRSYLVTKSYDLERHTAAYYTAEQQDYLQRYSRRHRDRLARDRTSDKIYDNGGFVGWTVSP